MPSPTGTVTLNQNTFPFNPPIVATLNSDGTWSAQVPSNSLNLGAVPITAIYSGDSNFVGSTSAPVSEQVNEPVQPAPTATVITTATPNPVTQ